MRRTSFSSMTCPIARTLERVGEWWSMLILRDTLAGRCRFDVLQESLGIAPNMLTRRLAGLVEAGFLEKHVYQERPARYEYRPTALARDFRPVLQMLQAYGNRHFAPEGASVQLADMETGKLAEPMLVDRVSGLPLDDPRFRSVAGPAANARTRRRHPARAAQPLLPAEEDMD